MYKNLLLHDLIYKMLEIIRDNGDKRLGLHDLVVDLAEIARNSHTDYIWVVRENGTHLIKYYFKDKTVKEYIENELNGCSFIREIKCIYLIHENDGKFDLIEQENVF